jgi:3-oxoacyl-[acyl-carrier-protein] synthase-3
MHASIVGIEFYLPENIVSTEDLSKRFPDSPVEKIAEKTGIRYRHVADEDECASDLAVIAVERLFASGICSPHEIDYVLLCTQSPDYALPTTACLLQSRLGIPRSTGALDFNLGCSGFVYGLGLAEGLISSNQARCILFITAETYSKYIGKEDKDTLMLFGDAAAASLICATETESPHIGPFVYGTDGAGGKDLILFGSGARRCGTADGQGSNACHLTTEQRWSPTLHMNGSKVFQFAVGQVPQTVHQLVKKAGISLDDVDLFVFHQANAYLLEEVRRILNVPRDKFLIALSQCANTISSSIPIALKVAQGEGRIWNGALVMLVGFGVGYSWGATIVRWSSPSFRTTKSQVI